MTLKSYAFNLPNKNFVKRMRILFFLQYKNGAFSFILLIRAFEIIAKHE